MTVTISVNEARKRLVAHLGLARKMRSARDVLERLRAIQLDPLDVIGTNADLVVMARVPAAKRGDVWRDLFPHHAFEHFFKERCILPASAFPFYRERGHEAQTPWWRHAERQQKVPKRVVDAVLYEVRERGPITARELTDHGSVDPIDWAGWMGTKKATSMALEMLWTTCDVVVAGRDASGAKLYDIPERSLGPMPKPNEDFERWQLRERARASGLYAAARKEAGDLAEVTIEGSRRRYLAVPEFLTARLPTFDDRLRILGPLDPLLWDRNLVQHVFDFEYVWEVYKPLKLRKWGWYVCPMLYRGELVGRIDAQIKEDVMVVRKVWIERDVDSTIVRAGLEDHAARCGCRGVRMRKNALAR